MKMEDPATLMKMAVLYVYVTMNLAALVVNSVGVPQPEVCNL